MLRRVLLFLLLSLPFCSGAFAQGQAGQAGEYLRWGVGAKALGFGRAFTSIADDASAMYWNPAGMSALTRSGGTLMFMHLPLNQGASMNYLGGAIPLRLFFIEHHDGSGFLNTLQKLKLGFGVLWHSLGDFDFYGSDASVMQGGFENSIQETAFLVSASYPLTPLFTKWIKTKNGFLSAFRGDLELGVTTKFLKQNLFGEQGSATSFDLGIKYTHTSGLLNLGFVWRDLNSPKFSYDSNLVSDKIPGNGVLGVSVMPPWGRLRGFLFSFDYGIAPPASRDKDIMFGMEYDFSLLNANYPIKLRIGSNSTHESFTFGIRFSPEGLFDQDWLPSGDWAYANDRSRYDAIGERYSFSLDRNPFTAKYWYLSGLEKFKNVGCHAPGVKPDGLQNESVVRHMRNAQEAKNPGNHAYRYEAALRIADMNFLSELYDLQHRTNSGYELDKRFGKVAKGYVKHASKYLSMDYGKSKVDRDNYFRSFMFYVQALILSNKGELASQVCANKGVSWGRKFHVFSENSNGAQKKQDDYLNYLQAYASYNDKSQADAIRILQNKLSHSSIGKFLLAHIWFLKGNYLETLRTIEQISLNDVGFPEDLYLPITRDCTFGDEVLFLKAASLFKLSLKTERQDDFILEFANIPRYFPRSDLARFLTNGDTILKKLIEHYKRNDKDGMEELVKRMIDSYVEAFSVGTLVEEFYTYNYR